MKRLGIFLLVFSLLSQLHAEQFYTISESQLTQLETTIDNQQNLLNEWEKKSKTWEMNWEELTNKYETKSKEWKNAIESQHQIIQQQSKLLQRSEKINRFWRTTAIVAASIAIGSTTLLIVNR